MIISEGTPMTNGEVFALLRRRRDERNAKLQPPFGLQFSSSSSSTSTAQIQPQRGSAPVMTNVSANTTLFFPPEALFMQDQQQGGVNSMASTMSMLNARNNALFASPTASHLIVLLTELRALRYLSKYATISGTNRVHQLYGPTSIHCRSRHHTTKLDKGEEKEKDKEEENVSNNNNNNNNNIHGDNNISTSPDLEDEEEGINDAAIVRQQEALMKIVQQCRPGTVNHVRAVDNVLSLWEMRGRNQELNSSNKVKMILRTLKDRLRASSSWNEEVSDPLMNENDQQKLSSSDRPRLMFAPPSVPLSMFLTEQPSSSSSSSALTAAVGASSANRDSGIVMNGSTAALQKEEVVKWTTQDLFRLVMARPRDGLDVLRVVDNLEELVGQNEELLNFVEEEIVRAFA